MLDQSDCRGGSLLYTADGCLAGMDISIVPTKCMGVGIRCTQRKDKRAWKRLSFGESCQVMLGLAIWVVGHAWVVGFGSVVSVEDETRVDIEWDLHTTEEKLGRKRRQDVLNAAS